MSENECCPKLDPAAWDGKKFEWENKKFIKDKVSTFFYLPLNFGSVMKRILKKVENSAATIPDYLCLSDHKSKWNMDVYLAADKDIANANNVTISGTFLSKVYEGEFKNTEKWCNDYKQYAKDRNLKIDKWYMWYTTCPKCAKKYGKNYVVIIGKVSNE